MRTSVPLWLIQTILAQVQPYWGTQMYTKTSGSGRVDAFPILSHLKMAPAHFIGLDDSCKVATNVHPDTAASVLTGSKETCIHT